MIRPLSLTRSSSWGRGMVCGMRSEGARGAYGTSVPPSLHSLYWEYYSLVSTYGGYPAILGGLGSGAPPGRGLPTTRARVLGGSSLESRYSDCLYHQIQAPGPPQGPRISIGAQGIALDPGIGGILGGQFHTKYRGSDRDRRS